jgi:hypothetical protein
MATVHDVAAAVLQRLGTITAMKRADAETAATQAIASAALEGIEFDDEWQNRLRDVASGAVTPDDAVADEINRLKRI